jgi:hypothetical protein
MHIITGKIKNVVSEKAIYNLKDKEEKTFTLNILTYNETVILSHELNDIKKKLKAI